MAEAIDILILVLVIGGRFLLPFLIFKYPLAIIFSLVLDAVDQTIFQVFTSFNLDGYQSYDKALDIYYLTIAFVSTFRNWNNFPAFKTSKFLYFYRLFGATLFELTQVRSILLIFPNTFEYFFIFLEGVRTRWNLAKITTALAIGSAAFIWIFIKLPQEYWIHIAQLDTTDLLKQMASEGSLRTLVVVGGMAVLLLSYIVYRIWKTLPKRDWAFTIAVDKHLSMPDIVSKPASGLSKLVFSGVVFEKLAMVSLVTIMFSELLAVRATVLELILGVAFVIVLNVSVSHFLSMRGLGFSRMVTNFVAVAVLNLVVIIAYSQVLLQEGVKLNFNSAIFFAILLAVLITLFDKYHPYAEARFKNL